MTVAKKKGKTKWRTRFKTKWRTRAAKKGPVRRRRKPMGILGKAGVITAGGVPVAWGLMDAGSGFWQLFQSGQYGVFESAKHAIASWVDSITCGFTTIKVFGSTDLRKMDGTVTAMPTNASSPAGGWAYTTFVGVLLAGIDRLMGKYLFKDSTKKIAGIQLISG